LAACKQLRFVNLAGGAKVSREGIAALRKELPQLEVSWPFLNQ
jgi:hypothetical protein